MALLLIPEVQASANLLLPFEGQPSSIPPFHDNFPLPAAPLCSAVRPFQSFFKGSLDMSRCCVCTNLGCEEAPSICETLRGTKDGIEGETMDLIDRNRVLNRVQAVV
jgi:hypothetical protein